VFSIHDNYYVIHFSSHGKRNLQGLQWILAYAQIFHTWACAFTEKPATTQSSSEVYQIFANQLQMEIWLAEIWIFEVRF